MYFNINFFLISIFYKNIKHLKISLKFKFLFVSLIIPFKQRVLSIECDYSEKYLKRQSRNTLSYTN